MGRGRYEVPFRAAWLYLRYGFSDLQSAYQTAFADFLRFFIRNRRFAYIVCIGFFHEEYHIVCVDFIAPCGSVIRKLRLAVVVCIAFFNEEYHIALVDFIYSSRGRLERDRGFRSPIPLQHLS